MRLFLKNRREIGCCGKICYLCNIYPWIKLKTNPFHNEKNTDIKFLDCDNDITDFFSAIKGKENLPEGSLRCKECYRFRLEKTAQIARQNNFDFFTTTLSISPHKNVDWINEIMESIYEKNKDVRPLYADFKKENGYLRSITLAKQFKLYRQNYCGCRPN